MTLTKHILRARGKHIQSNTIVRLGCSPFNAISLSSYLNIVETLFPGIDCLLASETLTVPAVLGNVRRQEVKL